MVQLVSTGEALMERRIAETPPGGVRAGSRDRDGDGEARFARGVGDVDEDAVLDRLGAGVGVDHGTECGGNGGLGHGRIPLRERGGGNRSVRGAGETGDGAPRRSAAGMVE